MIWQIICGVGLVICEELMPEVMPLINTVHAWNQIATGFEQR